MSHSAGSADASAKTNDLRTAATQFVSSAFVLPVLAQLRQSPLAPKAGPFAFNDVDKRFGPLLDQHLADRVTQAARFSIVDTIVNRYTQAAASTTTLNATA